MPELSDHPFAGVAPKARAAAADGLGGKAQPDERSEFDVDPPAVAHGGPGGPTILPQVVIGNDDRKPIVQTTTYPARAIAHIVVRYQNGGEQKGTGWFIGWKVLVTAAHVVEGNVKLIAAAPGRNGGSFPFGYSNAVKWTTSSRWNNGSSPEGDYAAIELEEPLGETVGSFGLRVFTDQALRKSQFWVAGYPADKPDGTMWAHQGPVQASAQFLEYATDTREGQSGAPVFLKIDSGFWAAALHIGGREGIGNQGIRITNQVYAELMSWRGGL